MKRLHLILLLGLLGCMQGLHAQEDQEQGEQLLVFRNTGVVNLLYTHEVDSILTTDSTQVFYAKDTTLVVPFAELDSVAVGSRNVRKLKATVHELTEERDLPWLIRIEENHLFYRQNTPQDILPKVGEKLFYGDNNDMLQYGLSVQVVKVTERNGEQDVEVMPLTIEEIFDDLFFSGRVAMRTKDTGNNTRRRAPKEINECFPMPENLDMDALGELKVKGETLLTGDVVIDVKNHYYHAHMNADTEIGLEYSLKSDDSAEKTFETPRLSFPLPVIAWVFHPRFSISLFADLTAELAFNYQMKRKFHYEFDWTRKDGKQTCQFTQPTGNEPTSADDEAKVDLTLSGELFLGARAIFDFNLTGDRVGFRADAKVGPDFEGKLSMGVLRQLRNYDPQLFGNATLSACLKLGVKASAVSHEFLLVFGDEVETPIYEHDFIFLEREINLFPNYQQSRATAITQQAPQVEQVVQIDLATAVPEPTPTNLEAGFEIVDPKGEVVDSQFVGTILAKPEDVAVPQTFETKILLPPTIKQENLEDYVMHPIFHYAGYTISAAPVGINKDVLLQPYTSTKSNGAMTFISSGPFIGSAIKDGTLYQVGTYLPVPLKNNVYQQGKDKKINPSLPIDDNQGNLLIGTWTGKVNDTNVTLTFNEDETGEYNNRRFLYSINEPQSGELLLTFENNEAMILSVLSVTETELKLKDKRDKAQTVWILTK